MLNPHCGSHHIGKAILCILVKYQLCVITYLLEPVKNRVKSYSTVVLNLLLLNSWLTQLCFLFDIVDKWAALTEEKKRLKVKPHL